MTVELNGQWNATAFFRTLTERNRMARELGFAFCRISGLEGLEQALHYFSSVANFVCVSDISDGYMELSNTPHSRSIKTVFFAMRHAVDDLEARQECMVTMRELFRQYMSKLLLEKVQLEENCIYLDSRITFSEIERYFFNGAACAYFQIAVDVYTDLRQRDEEWITGIKLTPNEIFLTRENNFTADLEIQAPGEWITS